MLLGIKKRATPIPAHAADSRCSGGVIRVASANRISPIRRSKNLLARRNKNVAAVALANKNARTDPGIAGA